MNKKKFFATCTLVAFGATMVPAMAFADETPAANDSAITQFLGVTNGFATNVSDADGLKVILGEADTELAWLSADDTLKVIVSTVEGHDTDMKLNDLSNELEIESGAGGVGQGDGSTTAPFVVLKAKENANLLPGYYTITVTDKQGSGEKAEKIIKAPLSPALTVSSSAGKVTDGKIQTPAKVGKITIATVSDSSIAVYDLGDLGEDGYYTTINGKTKKLTATLTSGEIVADELVAGHTYAIYGDGTAIASTVYPTNVFKYTDEVDTAVKAAQKAAKDAVNNDLSKIKDTITVEIPATGADIKLSDASAGELYDGINLAAGNKVFVSAGSGENGIIVADSRTVGKFTTGAAVIDREKAVRALQENGLKDVSLKIKVVIQNDTTKTISDQKPVTVILTVEKTAEQKMADYAAKYLTDYDAGYPGSGQGTAKLTLSKVGDGFAVENDVPSIAATGDLDFDNCFDEATGKVVQLPKEDAVGTVTLTFDTGKTITVTTTIKADGSSQPSDDEKVKEAAKAVNTSVTDFATVYAKVSAAGSANGAAISDAEWAELQAAYLKVITAYTAYSALL